MKLCHAVAVVTLVLSPLATAQEPEPSPRLSCVIADDAGAKAGSLIVQLDESVGSVTINSNLQFPAEYSDSSIRWKMGVNYQGEDIWFTYSINRYTGDLSVNHPEFPQVMTGRCTRATEQLF